MGLLNNSNAIESGGYSIDRSLRTRSSASANLRRVPSVTGNAQKFTLSTWKKLGSSGGYLAAANLDVLSTVFSEIELSTAGNINLRSGILGVSYTWNLSSIQLFRDPSAWYHIVVAYDTTQVTDVNRCKVWVNNQLLTFTGTYPAQNYSTAFNTTAPQYLFTVDGYAAEVNFIDGQALTPSSFGETSTETGVWTPKKYTGTYGANGFYLDFKDNTSATTLAYDKSGNGNNWTANNISTTAGATYDSMTDVPTLTSATAANYCVLNPLNKASTGTLSNGNLQWVTPNDANNYGLLATFGIDSGKWYWEAVITNVVAYSITAGFVTQDWPKNYIGSGGTAYFGLDTTSGLRASAGVTTSGSTVTVGLNDVIGIAFDADGKTATIYKNNTSIYTFSNIPNVTLFPAVSSASNTVNINFGQRPFSYTPPTGFKALNTFNLPDPVIKKPNQYMDATTFAANNSTQSIVNAGSFQPDLVWTKSRSNAYSHDLFDSSRGVNTILYSNATTAETATANSLTSFNSNGFTLGAADNANFGSGNSVAWQWKESATSGFDIVTWTQANPSTLNHSLGVKPAMIIIKGRGTTDNWVVWHQNLTNQTTYALQLNTTTAQFSSAALFNSTAPTSTQFTVGTGSVTNGTLAVAYLFAEIAGFSKFGSYTGNGSADGPFVYCGFRPKYVMIKETTVAGRVWDVKDSTRNLANETNSVLYPHASAAEATPDNTEDFLSNGFKLRSNATSTNIAGGNYIYMAFAENPFKYSNAR